jgi:acyl-CoA synthetase (NDP forming)
MDNPAQSLHPFFHPRGVALVGASRNPAGVGGRLSAELIAAGFTGPVHLVNPNAAEIGGRRCVRSARDLPPGTDLAIIAVPRDAVIAAAEDCAAAGVKTLVVISAGFAETGPEGAELQRRLVQTVRGRGMRMIGPNCMGLLNTDPAVRLNASFSPVFPPAGRIAMSSQSGALGLAILAMAKRSNLGLSGFVSVGNKADVSVNDLLEYWEHDPATDVILLYVESFGNPRKFSRIARRVGRTKPIIAVKSGRSAAGSRAAGSHTAALAAGETAVQALFRQSGVVRADTLEEMFDLAALFGSQPFPHGKRVGIVTNAGGPAILCADACEAGGLVVPPFSDRLRTELGRGLPAAASAANPVDMIAAADAAQYRRVIGALLNSDEIDALAVIHIPVGFTDPTAVAAAIHGAVSDARSAGAAEKTVVACVMSEPVGRTFLVAGDRRIPSYPFPETAGRALARAVEYAEHRARPAGTVPEFADIDAEAARAACRRCVQAGGGWLSVEECRAVLRAIGLPYVGRFVRTADAAAAAARGVGFPAALKLASETIIHKTEVGGVRLNLADEPAVRAAFDDMRTRLAAQGRADRMQGAIVQPMIGDGIEVMVGLTQDPVFGPLVAFGLGGIHVEILGDVVFRMTPLTDLDADEMIRSIRGRKLLEGYRGRGPADLAALCDLLLRVSRLAEDLPEVTEMDLNPVFALAPGKGCRIADARIRVGSAAGNPGLRDAPSAGRTA